MIQEDCGMELVMEKWKTGRVSPPWRPLPELEEMRRWFENDVAGPVMRAVYERIPEEQKAWAPRIEVFETSDNFVVKAELPGIKYEDIDVSAGDDELMIKGEKKQESNVKDEDYHRSEIVYGGFRRSVAIPPGADAGHIEATFEDGVLRVVLPKIASKTTRKVPIKVKKEKA